MDGDEGLDDLLAEDGLTSLFQPIVDLDGGAVVAYEALARGPQGALRDPSALFAAARRSGLLAELDHALQVTAFTAAAELELFAPTTLFVNVEPEVLDSAPIDRLRQIAADAPQPLRVVLEITERALSSKPAELLRAVEQVRSLGWGVALDDVGVDPASLAFLPLLRPDVVKLDLGVVQGAQDAALAEIAGAVHAYAERTGAVVLAEGIETEAHLTSARALGATLGQGWLFGRATGRPAVGTRGSVRPVRLPAPGPPARQVVSPFAALRPGTLLRRAPKRLLVELSKHLEQEALRAGRTAVVAATFQDARQFTAATARRYAELAERTGFVCALGVGIGAEPAPGVRGADLAPDDPVRGEWDVVVVSPHVSGAILARDLGDDGPDPDRTFEYAVTYDRDTVVEAARGLVGRLSPDPSSPGPAPARPWPVTGAVAPLEIGDGRLLQRALASSSNGVTVVDVLAPDQPLVFVNAAFEALAGLPASEVIGRNCRLLQGETTDVAAVARIREAVAAGRECRETLLNHRGPDREPWWNELHLAPVTDDDGRVVQYIGIQNDVTDRVTAERALVDERRRTRQYLARIEQLARTDPLTGVLNRRRVEESVEAALADPAAGVLALLFMDLDGFKAVNDSLGHAAGDELLVRVARRLQEGMRPGDLLARFGGDEFVVVATGLDPDTATVDSAALAAHLSAAVARPVVVAGELVTVSASTGVATSLDASDFATLLHLADTRMYALKQRQL